MPGLAIDEGDDGLAPERTSLAWSRTGIAFFVAIAALGRRVWPIDTGNHGWVVLAIGLATLAILAGMTIARRVGTHDRYAGETMHRRAFQLVAASTFVLACAAFALALFPA